jgi:hypothetical protein
MDIQLFGSHENNKFLYKHDKQNHLCEQRELYGYRIRFNSVAVPLCAVGRIIILLLNSIIFLVFSSIGAYDW